MPNVQKIQTLLSNTSCLHRRKSSRNFALSKTRATQLETNTGNSSCEVKNLPNGWYKISPLLNGYVKVFETDKKVPSSFWIIVWAKELASVFLGIPHNPVPKKSLIYKHITSENPEKQKTLENLENILQETFFQARDFLSKEPVLQNGIEIVGEKGYFMAVKGTFGIKVSYEDIDELIKSINESSEQELKEIKILFKTSFVHEMVHWLRKEIYNEGDTGDEIASHAVEFLSGKGENSLKDTYLAEEVIKNPDNSYKQDTVTGLKVVQKLLSQNKNCQYIPKSHEPKELNKAIKSIREKVREEILKTIANEIINKPVIDLFRIAAQANVTQIKIVKES